MRCPARVISFASLVAILLAAGASSAQRRQPRDDGDERARQHFETGAILYGEENYEGALAAFEESYRLREVPVVLFNIAQTLRRLNRYDEAIDAYQRYLRDEPDLPPERRNAVRATIAELERALAPVTIETDVPGVTIEIDGRVVGTTPLDGPLSLTAGQRAIVARRDGYVTVREELRIVGGEPQSITLRMAQADTAGVLSVRSNVADAIVRIDGVEVGAVPVTRRLGQGGHAIEVAADGYETFAQEIVLAPRQRREVLAELDIAREIWERWWFWAAVGGVAVVGIAIGVGVAASGGQADPVPGTLGTVAALR